MKKKKILMMIIIIIIFIVIGVTYAFINQTLIGTKRQVITVGNLELELKEENILTIEDALPMYDEVGMIQKPFEFQVISKATTTVSYVLKLVDITSEEALEKSVIKYGLTKDGEVIRKDYLSTLTTDTIDSGIIEVGQIIKYELRLWIDAKEEENSKIEKKSFSCRIDLSYGQNIEEGEFKYLIESEKLESNQITIEPNSSEELEIILTSMNEVETRYEMYYKIIRPDKDKTENKVEGGYVNNTEQPKGTIKREEKKEYKLIFNNTGNDTVVIELGIQSGLPYNEFVLEEGRQTLLPIYKKYYIFDYTGDSQEFVAPVSGTYKIELWGAGEYGNGGYTAGVLGLNSFDSIYVYIGGTSTSYSVGGYNGGGKSGIYVGISGSSGAGSTDIRLMDGNWNDITSLRSRIMVAAGGCGCGGGSNGDAGGLSGYTTVPNNYPSQKAYGASQKAGGSSSTGVSDAYGNIVSYSGSKGGFGFAGNGGRGSHKGYGGGGGSGYYGGGGGVGAYSGGWGGGGGSSFISGHAGCIAIKSESDQSPKVTTYSKIEDSYHYSGKIFTDTVMIDGRGYNWTTEKGEKTDMPTHDLTSTMVGNSGNGYARITYIGNN